MLLMLLDGREDLAYEFDNKLLGRWWYHWCRRCRWQQPDGREGLPLLRRDESSLGDWAGAGVPAVIPLGAVSSSSQRLVVRFHV